MLAWVPSQKGLVLLPPQRHNRVLTTRLTTRPAPLVISREQLDHALDQIEDSIAEEWTEIRE